MGGQQFIMPLLMASLLVWNFFINMEQLSVSKTNLGEMPYIGHANITN